MRDQTPIRDEAGPTWKARLAITRREFLGSSGALALTGGAAAQSAEQKPSFVRRRPYYELEWSSGDISRIWRLDPAWFATERQSIRLTGSDSLTIEGFLPGSNIPSEFLIRVEQRDGRWGLRWAHRNRSSWISCAAWFGGGEVPFEIQSYDETGFGGLSIRGGALAGRVRLPFNVELRSQTTSNLSFNSGDHSGSASGIKFEVFDERTSSQQPEVQSLANLLPGGKPLKTRLTLLEVEVDREGWRAGNVGGSTLRIHPELPTLALLSFASGGSSRVLLERRTSRAPARLQVGRPDPARAIFLDGLELIELSNGKHAIRLGLTDGPRVVQTSTFAAVVAGSRPVLISNYRGTARLELPGTLFELQLRGGDSARYQVDFRSMLPNGQHLDRSSPIIQTDQVGGVPAKLVVGRAPDSSWLPDDNLIVVGASSFASVALHRPGADALSADTPILRARRHEDALDLGFQFQGFRLSVGPGGSTISGSPECQRAVRLHPQHLQTEVFEEPDGLLRAARENVSQFFSSLTGRAPEPPKVTTRALGEYADYGEPGGRTRLARTRAAGASRIVFARQPAGSPAGKLDCAFLTDWSGLTLAVADRAAGDLSLDEQLGLIGIEAQTSREDAQAAVRRSIVPPSYSETSLELVTGLQFSPDASARFRTTGDAPTGGIVPLWTAQLELAPLPQGGSRRAPARVRALWASGLDPAMIIGGPCPSGPLAPDAAPFQTSLSGDDRVEIALQSSAYGLAAVRSLTPQGQDQPYSSVRLPRGEFAYLDPTLSPIPGDTSGAKIRQEGIISPPAFEKFAARLYPFAADIDIEWRGEPAGPSAKPFFARAFTVERYVHRTSFGTDVFTEVLYKGFLFPYGFRVALLKETTLEFWPISGMGAMAPSIQRFFIVPKRTLKTYPGVYQPFAGLDVPAREAELLGDRSPELDPAKMEPPAGIQLPPESVAQGCRPGSERKAVGKIFWPIVKESGAEVLFDFEADETGTRRTLPMLFLDNAAVKHPATVRAVVEYYNSLAGADERLRRENHHGGRTVYAAPRESGETSFETSDLLLKARGRSAEPPTPAGGGVQPDPTTPDPNAAFVMDAFMEGADEPPFYPVMIEARIRVPALDRLVGKPQGLKRVGYNGHYVRNGFDPARNPSEIFLNFLDAGGVMDLVGRGEVTGGLAHTPTYIAGISRINAIVGAEPRKAPAASALAPTTSYPPVGADHATPWNLQAVEENRFDPASFFKGAKLLGMIPLGEVVRAATAAAQPKLREVHEYALGAAGELIQPLRDACRIAAEALGAALAAAEQALNEFLTDEGGQLSPDRLRTLGTAPTSRYPKLAQYYPALTLSLEQLVTLLVKASNELNAENLAQHATAIVQSWKQVRGEVDAVIANPAPEPLRNVLGRFRAFVDLIQGSAGAVLEAAVTKALSTVVSTALDPLIQALVEASVDASGKVVRPWLFEAFFGRIDPDSPAQTREDLQALAAAVMANPEALPPNVAAAPVARAFTVPVARLQAEVRRLVSTSAEVTSETIERLVRGAVEVALAALDGASHMLQLVQAARAAAMAACAGAAKPLVSIATFALEAMPSKPELAVIVKSLERNLAPLELPDLASTPEVEAVRQAAAALRSSVNELAKTLGEAEVRRTNLSTGLEAICSEPGKMALLVTDFLSTRRRVLEGVETCATAASQVFRALAKLAEDQVAEASTALANIRADFVNLAVGFTLARLADAADEASSALRRRISRALSGLDSSIDARARPAAADVWELGHDTRALLKGASSVYTDAELTVIVAFTLQLESAEKSLLTSLVDFTALHPDLLTRLEAVGTRIAATFGDAIVPLHEVVLKQAEDAIEALRSAPDLVLLLTAKLQPQIEDARARTSRDLADLRTAVAAPTTAGPLIERWSNGDSGVVSAARLVFSIFDAIARGQVGAIFDLAAARRAVEDVVRRLIPSRVELTYDWGAELKAFPPSGPVFIPGPKNQDGYHLTIATRIEQDLLRPSDRKISVTGALAPFEIKLLGSLVELVTLKFVNTKFVSTGGSTPNFSTEIQDVIIGKDLEFIQALQSWLGSQGKGLSVRPTLNPPGVLVTYDLAVPDITLGALNIFNVVLGASALLPITDKPAEVGFRVGSRERPVGLIVAPCYYGGCYVSLTTRASEVKEFEVQLEFGAATNINFGPLRGHGRVTSGIYLSQTPRGLRLEGFVHAVGEGQIACFGISVNIEVKVVHEAGTMHGESTYRFSFRVGLVKVGYSFRAKYDIAGSGGARSLQPAGETKLVSANRWVGGPEFMAGLAPRSTAAHRFALPNKRTDWLQYRKHFVGEWPVQ